MNKYAYAIGMKNSSFSNPHGLSNNFNKSTCYDMAKLSVVAMRNPIIREIVAKR